MLKNPTVKGYLVERVINNEFVTDWRQSVRVIMDYALADALVARANKILDEHILDNSLTATEAAELAPFDPHVHEYDMDDIRYELSEIEVY